MKLTVVGSGDAFGSGGRAHTCMRLDSEGSTIVVDFGASALTSWKRLGFSTDDVDAILITHLHGDHFGGLPFLLLECQFVARRRRPLLIFGPPFSWQAVDIRPGEPAFVANFRLDTFEVVHPSGAPATAVRVEGDNRIFGYSGDTSWTSNLVEAARGADLFVIECYSGYQPAHAHIDWPTLLDRMPSLEARKIVVTHMSESAMARDRDMRAAGCVPAHDGLVVEF